MARVTKSLTAKKRHKKVLKSTKGHYGARSRLYKTAKHCSMHLEIEKTRKEASDHSGYQELTQLQKCMALLIQN